MDIPDRFTDEIMLRIERKEKRREITAGIIMAVSAMLGTCTAIYAAYKFNIFAKTPSFEGIADTVVRIAANLSGVFHHIPVIGNNSVFYSITAIFILGCTSLIIERRIYKKAGTE